MRTQVIQDALMQYAPRGSDIYYALMQVPKDKKAPYLAIHALNAELQKISEHYRELKVAQQKLAWWAEEIKALYQGMPKHPITQALQEDLNLYQIKEIELLAMVEAAMLSATTQIFANENELRQHYQHTGGINIALKAKILSNESDPNLMHQLGISMEILRHLLEMPRFLERQHLYLALSAFQSTNIDPQPILQGKNLDALKPLLEQELKQAQDLFTQVSLKLDKKEKQTLKPLLLELKLKLKQAQKTSADAWQIFSYRLELSPLVKFFLSWF